MIMSEMFLAPSTADALAMSHLIEALDEVDDALPLNCSIVSPITGEVINKQELARVRGILDGLLNNTNWVVVVD